MAWWICVDSPSGFTPGMFLDVCSFSSLSQSLCPALFSGIRHNAFSRIDFSHLHLLLAGRPECQVPSVVEGWYSGMVPSPHSMSEEQWMGHLRANPEFEVFWFIPPSWYGLSPANLLHRKDFPQSAYMGMAWLVFNLG